MFAATADVWGDWVGREGESRGAHPQCTEVDFGAHKICATGAMAEVGALFYMLEKNFPWARGLLLDSLTVGTEEFSCAVLFLLDVRWAHLGARRAPAL